MQRALPILALLFATTPAHASLTEINLDLTATSSGGDDSCSNGEDAVNVELERSFNLSAESWVEVRALEALTEGRQGSRCSVDLDDLIVEIDGVERYSFTIGERAVQGGNPDWNVSRTLVVPDIERQRLTAGSHTLTVRLEGRVDGEDERIRLTITGQIVYGRDWDDDTYDDIELAGGDDCNDAEPGINPGADEIWYDGVDQDCDGESDFDQDGDGVLAEGEGGDDCDDTRADTFPGAPEVWYDGIDQDCDGESDFDQDRDGFDSPDHGGDDCDDVDASKYPGARTWDEDCRFVVRTDDSRSPPDPIAAGSSGCSRGIPSAALLGVWPLLGLMSISRRRRRRQG